MDSKLIKESVIKLKSKPGHSVQILQEQDKEISCPVFKEEGANLGTFSAKLLSTFKRVLHFPRNKQAIVREG